MASVVFLRAVNVGGHQKFQPSALARQLAGFGVVNIGAAGTFVVRGKVSQSKLRHEILRRLPFKPELMICPARDVVALTHNDSFRDASSARDVSQFVSVMQKAPRVMSQLPIEEPAGGEWEVRIVAISGKFALSFRRPGRKGVYPNAVVEKHFSIPATTRNWNTVAAICDILDE